jgi:hypothetical protein
MTSLAEDVKLSACGRHPSLFLHVDLVCFCFSQVECLPSKFGGASLTTYLDRTKNSTRQLHESIVIEWMCKCECRTHRESALLKINFKMPKLILS